MSDEKDFIRKTSWHTHTLKETRLTENVILTLSISSRKHLRLFWLLWQIYRRFWKANIFESIVLKILSFFIYEYQAQWEIFITRRFPVLLNELKFSIFNEKLKQFARLILMQGKTIHFWLSFRFEKDFKNNLYLGLITIDIL